MTKTNVPRLRFKGFDGEWKDEKFKSLVERVKKTSDSDQYKKIEFSNIDEGKIIGKLSINDTKGIAFRKNDILFGKLRPYLKNWYYSMFDGVAVGDFWIFRAKRKISNSMFIYYLIQTHMYTRISNYTTGTKMPRSDWNFVSNSSFYISNLEEQQKIGSFFAKIDKLIELQTKKLEQLKKLKQGYLQKIFPQDGESVPRLRFSGFSGEWKEERLKSILLERNLKKEPSKEFPLMAFASQKGIVLKGDRYDRSALVKDDNKKYKITKFNDFIYSSNNFKTGSIGLNKFGDATISPVYSVFNVINNNNSDFFGVLSKNKSFIYKMLKYQQGVTYGQQRIKEDDFLKIIVRVPYKNEQQKIGSFFEKLDKLIEEQSNKLDQLKQQKKAYLQKMFI